MIKTRRDRRLQIEWTEDHVIKLIDAVKETPIIWDRSPVERLPRNTGTMIWNRISRQVFDSEISPREIGNKWQQLRSQYKEYVKTLNSQAINTSMVVLWKYFNRMRFLGQRTNPAIFTNIGTNDESCDNHSIHTVSTNEDKQILELPELPEQMDESELVSPSINIGERREYEHKPLIEIPELPEPIAPFELIMNQNPDTSTTYKDQSVQTIMRELIRQESQPIRHNTKLTGRDKILNEIMRPPDDSQIFGDYVALQMRQLSATKRRALEVKIQRSILETIDEPDVKEEID